MPITIHFGHQVASDHIVKTRGDFEVATPEELLAFANRVREAGGADVLEGLLPSRPGAAHICLLANALNFSSEIFPTNDPPPEGGRCHWVMRLPYETTQAQAKKIAKAVGSKLHHNKRSHDFHWTSFEPLYWVELPAEIGNAADAFDAGLAFTDLRS